MLPHRDIINNQYFNIHVEINKEKKMRIDAHQHFWKYSKAEYGWINDEMSKLKRDFLPEHIEAHLKENHLDGSIAVHARQTIAETEWLLQMAEKSDLIKGVVGWVDLRSEHLNNQLEEFAAFPKFVGVRHVVQDEPDDNFILREDFIQGIAKLADYDLTYDLLILEKHLPATIKFVKRFQQQLFVLDHIAKPKIKKGDIGPWATNIRELAAFPNVYCKVSGMVTEANWRIWKKEDFYPYLDVVFDTFGIDRIMFGSDWPVCTVAAAYADVLGILKDYTRSLGRSEKEKIFGSNAEQFYDLKNIK